MAHSKMQKINWTALDTAHYLHRPDRVATGEKNS